MARATGHALESSADDAPITLLYIRAIDEPPGGDLDVGLQTLVVRYAPFVELRVVGPGDTPAPFAELAHRPPTVLVLRYGQVVGEIMGAALPLRELDRAVRCAVEWPR
jgi:hypothetical protein